MHALRLSPAPLPPASQFPFPDPDSPSSSPSSTPSPTPPASPTLSSPPPPRAPPADPERRTWTDAALHLVHDPLALATDRRYYWLVAGGLLCWEALLCAVIIKRVPYTEIDFSTYLEQAAHFLRGERDYSRIEGESGKCYYPALHLYLYAALHRLVQPRFGTDPESGVPMRVVGGRLEAAQWAFAGVYVATMGCVMVVYGRNRKLPQFLLPLLTLSKRLHSIYVLRMFNDALAMLFFYGALVCYTDEGGRVGEGREETKGKEEERKRGERREQWMWVAGTVLFSLALATKMSLLLFLPGLLYLLFVYHSPLTCLAHVALIGTIQAGVAAPFILPPSFTSSASSSSVPIDADALAPLRTYASQAFSLSRAFLYEFTTNWRFLPPSLFCSPLFAKALLLAHAAAMIAWAVKWARVEDEEGVRGLLRRAWRRPGGRPARRGPTAERTATLLFTSNLTGLLFARSLHPQFYAWFAHQGAWMVFGASKGRWAAGVKGLVLLTLLDYAFSTYPSTTNSSLGFVVALVLVLGGVWTGRPIGEGRGEQPDSDSDTEGEGREKRD
ncbi:hypothetical protein JCM10207_004419 [Rhodosporidiobolus poonsookiae]